ncbi:hypothetical protein J7T55_003774 [Diaporthe amygdali]|uniref:uncharacterized protein n=1 Tax=Phomopsis amygdali TaxID=1214568 RepID=UPI0022FE5FE1|nr:uncharacterized protein J7T55_003774 [Diaporthe amygdali]KAJ0117360.1 hypothetical protein J7T55_003774 [Diaporthe amygdali]
METEADKTVSLNKKWEGLTDGAKKTICDSLAKYNGPDVSAYFVNQINWEHAKTLAMEPMMQVASTEKRKRDDSDGLELPCTVGKKARLEETTASSQSAGVSLFSPSYLFAWPKFRQSPITFGQPTLSSATAGSPPTVTPPPLATPADARHITPFTDHALDKTPTRSIFSPSRAAKAKKAVRPEPECDEQFTFADRRSRSPQPYAGPGSTQRHNPEARSTLFGQASSASFTAATQGTQISATVPTASKAPSLGVDMSSLKIPANSNALSLLPTMRSFGAKAFGAEQTEFGTVAEEDHKVEVATLATITLDE